MLPLHLPTVPTTNTHHEPQSLLHQASAVLDRQPGLGTALLSRSWHTNLQKSGKRVGFEMLETLLHLQFLQGVSQNHGSHLHLGRTAQLGRVS